MLNKYDNKIVRIECIDGKVYEGICSYNNNDYNFHEFNRDEEGLQILIYLFFKDDIKKIDIVDNFSDDYGTLEEEIVTEEEFIEDVLDCEDNIHIKRLLLCIKDKFKDIKEKEGLKELLNNLIKYNKDKQIIKLTKEILNNYGKN